VGAASVFVLRAIGAWSGFNVNIGSLVFRVVNFEVWFDRYFNMSVGLPVFGWANRDVWGGSSLLGCDWGGASAVLFGTPSHHENLPSPADWLSVPQHGGRR
jgi:hypothetical protein